MPKNLLIAIFSQTDWDGPWVPNMQFGVNGNIVGTGKV